MKKIFTLSIISILALCANAQKLSFSVDGKTIENGATVISTKLHDFQHGVLGKTVFAPEVLLTCDEDAEGRRLCGKVRRNCKPDRYPGGGVY